MTIDLHTGECPLKITRTFESHRLFVRVQGRFDAHTVSDFLSSVADEVRPDLPNVSVELRAVEFMDSSALAEMVTTLKRCLKHGGELILAGASDAVPMVMQLTRLDQVFPLTATPRP